MWLGVEVYLEAGRVMPSPKTHKGGFGGFN